MIALLLLAACDDGKPDVDTIAVEGLTVERSEAIATVLTARWTTATPTRGQVVYGGLTTPMEAEAATEHEVVLLGLSADTEVDVAVVLEDGGESESVVATTGSLPTEIPALTATGGGNDRYVLTSIMGGVTAAVILNPDGTVGWYHVDSRGLDVYRVRLSVDGRSVLYNAASVSGDPADDSELVRVSLDGTEETTIPVPLLAHDFVEHADGTIAAIVVEYRDVDGVPTRGDKLVEIAPDGTQTDVWSAWDCLDPVASPGDEPEAGWTFANALDWDPDANAYTLGMRAQSSILRIDRATGTCAWILGGESATVDFAEGSDAFLHQHQFDLTDDGIVVFDNDGPAGAVSRVLEYALDLDAGTAREVWSYTADPPVYSFVLGDVERLDDGDTMVTWSVGGQIERVSPEGVPELQVNLGLGYAFGFAAIEPSLYR